MYIDGSYRHEGYLELYPVLNIVAYRFARSEKQRMISFSAPMEIESPISGPSLVAQCVLI